MMKRRGERERSKEIKKTLKFAEELSTEKEKKKKKRESFLKK